MLSGAAIAQIGIAFTGVTAIFLTQSKSPNLQRHACLFGLAGQPFWIWSALEAEQWGILALTSLYAFAWAKGAWVHWIAPRTALGNPIATFAYTKPNIAGWTMTVGFDSQEDARRAHEIAVREFRAVSGKVIR